MDLIGRYIGPYLGVSIPASRSTSWAVAEMVAKSTLVLIERSTWKKGLSVDEIEDAKSPFQKALETKHVENRAFSPTPETALCARGSGVQIAPPRPNHVCSITSVLVSQDQSEVPALCVVDRSSAPLTVNGLRITKRSKNSLSGLRYLHFALQSHLVPDCSISLQPLFIHPGQHRHLRVDGVENANHLLTVMDPMQPSDVLLERAAPRYRHR